eukprot:38468-Rhodomonas_salina.7
MLAPCDADMDRDLPTRTRYTMLRTDTADSAICIRRRCAMPGADIAHVTGNMQVLPLGLVALLFRPYFDRATAFPGSTT